MSNKLLFSYLIIAGIAFSATWINAPTYAQEGNYILAEPLPVPGANAPITSTTFLGYLQWAFPFLLSIAAILAVVMIIAGGIQYMTSAGSTSAIEEAKNRITNAILGLLLAAVSWLILYTINPDLVRFRIVVPGLERVEVAQPPETSSSITRTPSGIGLLEEDAICNTGSTVNRCNPELGLSCNQPSREEIRRGADSLDYRCRRVSATSLVGPLSPGAQERANATTPCSRTQPCPDAVNFYCTGIGSAQGTCRSRR